LSYTWEYWKNGKVIVHRNSEGQFIKGHRHYPSSWIKPLTKEAREKISKANKGKKPSKETRLKMSKAKLRKKLSEEHKQKLSKSMKGKKNFLDHNHTKIAKEKIRQANLGKEVSTSTRLKLSNIRKKYCAKRKIIRQFIRNTFENIE